jgi:hypothetical protein
MIICGGFAPAFPFPKTKPIAFNRFPAKDGAQQENIARASQLRKELETALASQKAAQIAVAADNYLPLAVGMWRAMEQGETKEGRGLHFGLAFEWTSFTYRKPDKFFTMYSLRFEVMMVLICRMIAAGNTAASMLEDVQSAAEYEETAKAALQHVKMAAGLAHFISTEIQPLNESLPFERGAEVSRAHTSTCTLCLPTSLFERPLFPVSIIIIPCELVDMQVHPDMMGSITILYQATGQSIACRQAQNKGMSLPLLGKLFAAAAKLVASANLILKGITPVT